MGALLMGAVLAAAQTLPPEHPALGYSTAALTDPVSQLVRKFDQGKVNLAFDPVTGYLPAVLQALDIPVESQMAVFSKTSVQAMRIEPTNPRVLFYNDAVIAGWVRGGFVEFASQDPRVGMVFYRLDQRLSAYKKRMAAAVPESPFTRREDCLQLPHDAGDSGGFRACFCAACFPSPSGEPLQRGAEIRYRRPRCLSRSCGAAGM